MSAAARLFAQKGFANTTTKEIAREADMAEGTLYNYFDSKRGILLAVANEAETPMIAALQEPQALEDRDAMVSMFEKAMDISEAQLPFARTLFSEASVDDVILQESVMVRLRKIHQLLEKHIAERIAAGVFRPMDAALGARMVMSIFGGLILPALRGAAPLPSPEERHSAEMVVDLLLDGIRFRDS
jgi:AcrR family transcriptional regulator